MEKSMNEVLILPEELEFRNKCVEDHERLLERGFPAVSIKFSREGFPAPGYLVAEFRLEGKPMFKICYSPFYHNPKHEDLFEGYTVYGWARLRTLLVEAAQSAVWFDPAIRNEYLHRCHRKHRAVAKLAAARKLAVWPYWMLRTRTP